jgi:hypothetical protein
LRSCSMMRAVGKWESGEKGKKTPSPSRASPEPPLPHFVRERNRS